MYTNGASRDNLPARRDERGRLMPGSRIGVGNSGQRHRGELRRSLINADTPENIRKVGEKLVQMALDGDVQAAKVWLDHVLGRPLAAIEVSEPSRGHLDLYGVVNTIANALGDVPEVQARIAAALGQLELSEQVPAVRARERDEELIRAWLDRDWPRIKKSSPQGRRDHLRR